jgi:hypothetical protein
MRSTKDESFLVSYGNEPEQPGGLDRAPLSARAIRQRHHDRLQVVANDLELAHALELHRFAGLEKTFVISKIMSMVQKKVYYYFYFVFIVEGFMYSYTGFRRNRATKAIQKLSKGSLDNCQFLKGYSMLGSVIISS